MSKTAAENPINFSIANQAAKSSDFIDTKKQTGSCGLSKHREKNSESPVSMLAHQESPTSGQTMAKITVVPTSQLLAQKPLKSIQSEKFNPMDLTSSSLSITPVNDYQQKTNKLPCETKKDVISITPYNEPSSIVQNANESVAAVPRPEVVPYSIPNPSAGSTKPASSKYRHLPESSDGAAIDNKRTDDRVEIESHKSEKKEKRRDRWSDEKHRSHDSKKRRKEHKSSDMSVQQQVQPSALSTKIDVPAIVATPPSLSKEEQEQRQIEETMAATNFLSQIINDDLPRVAGDKRKDQPAVDIVDDNVANSVQQPSEQDNDVQMVMRSLKELQELQEMKYSPSHSPSAAQKASKSGSQYVGYQDDYSRIYKKDDKMRVGKEESPW